MQIAVAALLGCALAAPNGYNAYTPYPYVAPAYPAYAGGYAYYGPADIKVLPNGYLADTPEVAQARAAHLVAKSYVAAAAAANPDYDSYYRGGYAAPSPYVAPYYAPAPYTVPYAGVYAYYGAADIKVLPTGYLADTPEVAQARAAHLVAKSYAAAAAAASPEYASSPYVAPYSYTAPAYYPGSHY